MQRMKRVTSVWLLITLLGLWFTPMFAATMPTKKVGEKEESATPVVEASKTIAAITGIAISPLLGTGVYGAYKFVKANEAQRASLPWFASPAFFVPALLIAAVCAAKDSFGVVFPPGWKKPIDIAEMLENKLSGLVAAGAVVPITVGSLGKVLTGHAPTSMFDPSTHGFAMIGLGAIDWSWAVNIMTVPIGIAVFAVVWMASHAINVLIILSPWGAIDAALKAARTSVLGLLAVTTQFDPKSAAFMSILVIIVAYFVAGWSYRLMTFGAIFSWETITRRKARCVPQPNANRAFSSGAFADKVPVRTFGTWVRTPDEKVLFRYRPWFLLPERAVELERAGAEVAVGRGLFYSIVMHGEKTLFILPPRYRDHEEEFAKVYGLGAVRDVGLLKAWSWIRDGISGKSTPVLVS
jgi:hypothetical protein